MLISSEHSSDNSSATAKSRYMHGSSQHLDCRIWLIFHHEVLLIVIMDILMRNEAHETWFTEAV